ncbi:MAG: glycosyltransferase [Ruminococcus sp.]
MDNHIDINKSNYRKVYEYHDISFVPMPRHERTYWTRNRHKKVEYQYFGRLYMASALPETVHKVLNIDCDTIIVDSIEPLWNTDMTGKVFGGQA